MRISAATFRDRALGPLILIALVFGAYSVCYNNSFLFDDEFLIQKNTLLRSWGDFFTHFRTSSTGGSAGVDSFYRPLQGVLYLITYQIAGLSTFAFHFLNVLIHALNAVLIFLLAGRLGFQRTFAFAAAAIWAAHPIHTEAVTYMSATADTSYTFFCLLGVWSLLPEPTSRRQIAALACFFMGLLCKESTVVFPALAVAVLFAVSARPFSWRTYVPTWSFWLLTLGYFVARKTFLNFDSSFEFYKSPNIYSENLSYRFFTFLATLPDYFKLIVWPEYLSMERNFPVFLAFWPDQWTDALQMPTVQGALMIVVGFLPLIWAQRSRAARALGFGTLWFWAAHAPHTGVLIPVNAIFLEHWMYLPTIGPALGIAQALWLQFQKNVWMCRALATSTLVVVVALTLRTLDQNQYWENPVVFYQHLIQTNPKAVRAYNNLGMAYSDLNQNELAIESYQKAIEISDSYAQTRHNLALLLVRVNRIPEAIQNLQRALEINPEFFHSYLALAQIYQNLGNSAKAQEFGQRGEELRRKYTPR